MDLELLINEVRARKALWNLTHPDHHNRNVLNGLWEEVGVKLNTTSQAVRIRWKYLKDQFRRELNKIIEHNLKGNHSYKPTWVSFELMLFIQDHISTKKMTRLANEFKFGAVYSTTDSLSSEDNDEDVEIDVVAPDNGDSLTKQLKTKTKRKSEMAPYLELIDTVCYKYEDIIEVAQDIQQLEKDIQKSRKRKLNTLSEEMKQRTPIETIDLECYNSDSNDGVDTKPACKTQRVELIKEEPVDVEVKEKLDFQVELLDESDDKNDNYNFLMSLLPQLDKFKGMQRVSVQHKIQECILEEMSKNNIM